MGRADTGHSAGVDAVAPAISPDVEAGTESLWLVRRLGGQSLYVLAGNLFTLCVGLPLQIYVSRHLGSGGLGTFSLLEGVAATVAGLLGFGLAQTAVRFIPQYLEQGSYRAARRLIVRAFALLCVAGAAGYVVLLGASLAGWKAFGAPADVVAVMGAMIPLGLLAYFAQQCLWASRKFAT